MTICSIITGLWIPVYSTFIGDFGRAIKSIDTLAEVFYEADPFLSCCRCYLFLIITWVWNLSWSFFDIDYQSVKFRYPPRRDVQVLNDFNIEIKRGTTVPFVGKSRCGKSTVSQLLPKFHCTSKGVIKLNRIYIKSIGDYDSRSLIGLVGQGPIFFLAQSETTQLKIVRMIKKI